ncbi:ChuX/HutX family heme-like substrate-binding protein [Paraburkholderia bonniea]|uniref:hemin-degrading factor n=1 Tax=Paraburkholderia bonniea TaxID=2152891 RepID=UPI0012924791|nr:ChuX/HutX family heme-like substrate-binding protein [Paraburkholderia bonniea]WJF92058.1 ChuX/HutX family heme-like substrate-binding protein [Paraburkholderia bonniea]WJF95378.1 ChuX/HutX family heme-like substrate-binding protein [Paraburkholderia bonniea]
MLTSTLTEAPALQQLQQEFLKLKETQKLRNREAAHAMGISEGEALAAFVGHEVVRLKPSFIEIMEEVPQLGRVMALTRNEAAVHEKDGPYEKMSHDGTVGLALGELIDLRIFYHSWASGFAVVEDTPRGPQKSLQFFDAQGHAVHKIYLREHSDHAAFDALVERWSMDEQVGGLNVAPAPAAPAVKPDSEIDVAGFHAAWDAMTDTHQFFGMLRKFGLARTQALRLAPRSYAQPVANDELQGVLESAAQIDLPIMVFVGNRGMIQIHSGPVKDIRVMGPWLNVLDPGFNLHLRADLIASAWVVRKPTSDGIVTSLELFDANGENIAMLFGARKPGTPELEGWRDLIAGLAPLRDKALA